MSDTDNEDILAVDKALSGDIEAFGGLVKKYQGLVYRYAVSRFNDFELAMDLTQEIFLLAMESLPGFRRESTFLTWLCSIMINKCKNHKKKITKYPSVTLSRTKGTRGEDLQLHDERQNTEERVIMSETLEILRDEMNRLPEDYRDILLLRDVEGLPYDEIAKMLTISLSNVKVRIHRGREFLKNRLYARGLV